MDIVRNQVSNFHLSIELANNSTRAIHKEGEEIPVDLKKKRKGEEKISSTLAHKLKHKEGISNIKFDLLFGDHPNENTLKTEIF